jgi:hypothetical protein
MRNYALQKGPCSFLKLRISLWEVSFLFLLYFFSPWRLFLFFFHWWRSFSPVSLSLSFLWPDLATAPWGTPAPGRRRALAWAARLGRGRRRASAGGAGAATPSGSRRQAGARANGGAARASGSRAEAPAQASGGAVAQAEQSAGGPSVALARPGCWAIGWLERGARAGRGRGAEAGARRSAGAGAGAMRAAPSGWLLQAAARLAA